MLTEVGKVLAVEAAGAWVETLKTSTCAQCQARHGCGQKLLASSDAYTRVHVDLPSELANLQPGERVVLGIDESAFVSGVLLAYGVPLSTMLLAVLVISRWPVSEAVLIVCAIAGLLAGGLIVRFSASAMTARKCYRARLLSRVGEDPERVVNIIH